MATLTFIIETAFADSEGTVIKLDGVSFENPVLVTDGFDPHKPITKAEVVIEGDYLKATADIPDEFLDRYPGIGFQLIEREGEEVKGCVHKKIDLFTVGLSINENLNPDIKTIREQTTKE